MSQSPRQPSAPPGGAAAVAAPPADVNARIVGLRAEIEVIRKDLVSMQGKLKNRDPSLLNGLKEENARLKQRLVRLESAAHGLNAESLLPRDPAEAKAAVETLRLAAVEHCKKTNVDTNLWKKIES